LVTKTTTATMTSTEMIGMIPQCRRNDESANQYCLQHQQRHPTWNNMCRHRKYRHQLLLLRWRHLHHRRAVGALLSAPTLNDRCTSEFSHPIARCFRGQSIARSRASVTQRRCTRPQWWPIRMSLRLIARSTCTGNNNVVLHKVVVLHHDVVTPTEVERTRRGHAPLLQDHVHDRLRVRVVVNLVMPRTKAAIVETESQVACFSPMCKTAREGNTTMKRRRC
jgi:hypothetical protein